MRQYHENFAEEAEEYRLAVAKRAKSSEKASPRLRKIFGGVEGSDGDEPAYIDEEGDNDKYGDSSINEVMIDDESIVNQIGQNVMSGDDLTPRHSTALIAVSISQSKKRLLTTSTKRGSKKFTLQSKFSTSPLHKKANRKSGASDHTPLRPQVLSCVMNCDRSLVAQITS